ncbi:MAG: fibronectin type III domain-containing protein [Clostridia bacterium]|nr:fibronectin type III domain-containing protein [Clostridia bacterium]
MKFKRILALALCLCLALPLTLSVAFAASAPSAPELSVTQLAGRFSLSWSVPYNGGSEITGYRYTYYLSEEEPTEPTWINIVDTSRTQDTTPLLDRYGEEYTFRIKAVNAQGESEETVVHKSLQHQNHIDVYRVRDRVEQASFSATLQEASTSKALKKFLEGQIKEMNSKVKATVNVTSFEAAQLTQTGAFKFTVSLSLGNPGEPTYASTVTETLTGVISSSGKLSAPTITIDTSEEGGLTYEITTTGTAAQAEVIQGFKVSVFDTVNDQAVVSDYNISASEKTGTINLSAGLKGEATYRAAVKACSADELKYLDSDLSELSAAATAGRIPVTLRPSVTEKFYGDTEPIFSYEIVKGPNPLPTGVDLKLTFTRAQGNDVGTYAFSFQQTDTNYLVTLEESVFEILARPITIRPADRELNYQQGTTYLPDGIAKSEGLVEGDKIDSVEYDPKDARGDVGEFEITPIGAVITSGGKDVTKNYDISFEPGKVIVRPVGYDAGEAESDEEDSSLLLILIIIAAVLLIAAAVVLVILLRKKNTEEDEETEGEEETEDTIDEETPPDSTEGYEEYLEIIDLEEVENEAEADDAPSEDTLGEDEFFTPPETDSATQATIEEIENAQAKTEAEE